MYESLLALQNCMIAHRAPHNEISAPAYKGLKSSEFEKVSEVSEHSGDGGGDGDCVEEDGDILEREEGECEPGGVKGGGEMGGDSECVEGDGDILEREEEECEPGGVKGGGEHEHEEEGFEGDCVSGELVVGNGGVTCDDRDGEMSESGSVAGDVKPEEVEGKSRKPTGIYR